MGFGGISVWQLVIVAVIIALLFGTKKLRSVGTDLGSAVKGFKKAVIDEESKKEPEQIDETASVAQKVEQTELSDDKQKS